MPSTAPSPPGPPLAAETPAWRWVPLLYVAQGLPYAAVMGLSIVMLKNLGVDNQGIALATAWLNLPWVLKPLWAPLVQAIGPTRRWVLAMQGLAGIGFTLQAMVLASMPPGAPPAPWLATSAFWLLAFASATHDVAADGFYVQALDARGQAAWVGIRSAAWRLAQILAQGGLVALAGLLQRSGRPAAQAWAWVFALLALAFAVLPAALAWALPHPPRPPSGPSERSPIRLGMVGAWRRFFARPAIVPIVAFLLLDRLAEALLVRMLTPFLLDARHVGGLGLRTEDVGLVYGTLGVGALTLGGIAGGLAIARLGLRRCWWPMVAALHAPNLLYVALAALQPEGLTAPAFAIAVEQAGYGFGFAAYMVFMLRIAAGPDAVAHYALATGLMALGMMVPGLAAGWLQQSLGWPGFFALACAGSLPAIAVAAWASREVVATLPDEAASSAA